MDPRVEPGLQVVPAVYVEDPEHYDGEVVRQVSERLIFQVGAILVVCAAAVAGYIVWFLTSPVPTP